LLFLTIFAPHSCHCGCCGKTLLKAEDLHDTDVGKIAGTAESAMGVKEMVSTQPHSTPSDKQPGDSGPDLQHLSACHIASKQKARQQGQGPCQPSLSVVPQVVPANHTVF